MLDAERVADTLRPLNGEYFTIDDLEAYAQKVTTSGKCLQVEGDDGDSLAYVLYYDDGPSVFVSMVWVDEVRRREGLARKLLQRLIRSSDKDVELEVADANPALSLYQSLGFRRTGSGDRWARKRRAAIMQPYVFPYIGYFHLIEASHTFVFYDDVHYIRRGWVNRNNILLDGQQHRFTIPVANATQNALISEIAPAIDRKWLGRFESTLRHAYAQAPHWDEVSRLVMGTLADKHANIADLAIASVEHVYDYLERPVRLARSSSQSPETRGTERVARLATVTKQAGHGAYVNAAGGRELYSHEAFAEHGVDLAFVESASVTYEQGKSEFVSWLSIIDVLMYNDRAAVCDHLERFVLRD